MTATFHQPALAAPSRPLRVAARLLLAYVALLAIHVALMPDLYPLADMTRTHILGVPVGTLLRIGFLAAALLVTAVALRAPVLVALDAAPTRSLIVGAFLASVAIALLVLRSFPNSADEYHLLFQADTFRQRRLWQDPPPLPDVFQFVHVIERDGKWVSHFPPGWALVLAAWRALGLQTVLVGPVFGAALLWMTAAFARQAGGVRVVFPAVLLVAVTPFFLFNAASLFSHCFAATLLLLLFHFAERFRIDARAGDAAIAGLALGALGVTRYFTAGLGALACLAMLLPYIRQRHLLPGLAALATGGVFLAGLLAYDRAVTGNALQTVSGWAYPSLRLGLWSVNEFGIRSTPLDAVKNVVLQWIELSEFTSPILPLAYLAALLVLVRDRALRIYDLLPLLFAAGLFFYPEIGGNRYGPRYWFDAFPFAAVAIARAFCLVWSRREPAQRALLSTALLAHLAFAVASIPFACAYFRTVVDQRMALYDDVDARRLQNALVLLTRGTGTLRPMLYWDLTRNGTRIDPAAPVLYAIDDGRDLAPLLALYPARSVWRWNGTVLSCVEHCP